MARARDLRLTPPIPALHPERDALLAAVRDADPADDLPALVYADWQDEHGQPEHAELIRVMVELPKARKQTPEAKARKKLLIARMKELFTTPAIKPFRAIESNVWRFQRGFVPNFVLRMYDAGRAQRLPHVRPDQLPELHERVPFDKLAWLGVTLPQRPTVEHAAVVAGLPWLRRVDTLGTCMWDSEWVRPGTLAPLVASKHLGGLRQFHLSYDWDTTRGTIAASELVALFLAKSATGLRVFPLADVQRQVTTNRSAQRSVPFFLKAVEQVVISRRARQFTSFESAWGATIDTALARILLASPHLGGVRAFRYSFRKITAVARVAFEERFGKPEEV